MTYGYSLYPIKAALEGGEFDGKTIELPQAFRGVDVQELKGPRAARYRFARQQPDGSFIYEYAGARRQCHRGAAMLKAAEDLKAAGLGFYPAAREPGKDPF